MNGLEKKVCRYLRALSKGKAYEIAANESTSGDRDSTSEMVAGDDGAQPRTFTDNGGNMVTASRRGTNIDGKGFLEPTANAFAVAFSEDMHLFAGLSGTEDFFELWEVEHFSVVSIFYDKDVRDAFQRTDFQLFRTAAFSNQVLWNTLMERTVPSFDREGAERYVCELLGDQGRCGMVFASWKKYMAHQTHKSGNHGIKSPLRVSVITNQCVNCGSTFEDRPTAQNHVVSSWTTGTCRTDRSHMNWALEEIILPISCNLCAQEFGDLQTYYTHARLTHLPFPAPTIRESNAQPARQPSRQHARDGQEREPRDRQEGRQQRRRGAAKAASTNRQQNQARRRNPRIDGSGSQAAQGRIQVRAEEPQQADAQGNSQNAPDDARTDPDDVGHTVGQSIEPRSRQHMQKQTQTYAEKVRQEGRGAVGSRTAQGIATYWARLEPLSRQPKHATRCDSAGWKKRTKQTSRESR